MGISDFVKKISSMGENKKAVRELSNYLSDSRVYTVKDLLSKNLVKIEMQELDSIFIDKMSYPKIVSLSDKVDANEANSIIRESALKTVYDDFSKKAYEIIPQFIAPNIEGMGEVKQACAIQLFSKQPVHILLLGDPGTGKTDILRSSFNLSPVSSFGLGSGTSGVGLVATVKGNKVMKGLIPLADNGICCIDELNLMKEDSRGGLYNAMEKGFVTYDKGGHHYQFDARIRVLATANPKGDEFSGETIEELKKEMPFDSALLSRFHLTFFIRKPDLNQFKDIATSIASGSSKELSKGDIEFLKGYVEYSLKKEVNDIRKGLQKKVVDFITEIKKNEEKYLIEVSPRLVVGFMRMCKALALMHGRDEVIEEDIFAIKDIVKKSLKV